MTGNGGLRIAIIGSRGIPAGYGGFETFTQELAPRLVDLGHDVTVYCRKGYTGDELLDEYKGVNLVYTPALKRRELEQLSHEATCIADSLRRKIDLYYVLGYRASLMYAPLRATKRTVVINTNGLEWRRSKWSGFGRRYLKFAEWAAVRLSAEHLVSDAKAIRKYFLDNYDAESEYLCNGAYTFDHDDLPAGALDRWNLKPGGYYIVACRIEPENNIHLIIQEHVASGSEKPLVVIGGMNYETPYWQHLQELGRKGNVRFLGPVYGPMLVEHLHLGCYGYLHGHEVGGTNPALLKAMGCGNLVIALNTDFNSENLADTGRYFDKRPGTLAEQIRWADVHPDKVATLGERARARIRDGFTWDHAARRHDAFFRRITGRNGGSEA